MCEVMVSVMWVIWLNYSLEWWILAAAQGGGNQEDEYVLIPVWNMEEGSINLGSFALYNYCIMEHCCIMIVEN